MSFVQKEKNYLDEQDNYMLTQRFYLVQTILKVSFQDFGANMSGQEKREL